MTAFVDTSALLAMLDADDVNHDRAREVWLALVAAREQLTTTNYVAVETLSLVQRRFGMDTFRRMALELLAVLDLHWVDAEVHRAGLTAVLAANRRRLSLVDCTSFEIMMRNGLRRAFAYDQDFNDQGFEVL
jgi:predicted nucleic acid-binding protein